MNAKWVFIFNNYIIERICFTFSTVDPQSRIDKRAKAVEDVVVTFVFGTVHIGEDWNLFFFLHLLQKKQICGDIPMFLQTHCNIFIGE
jgi:hypothetical protein